MKKISKINWERYKNSQEGQSAIAQFEQMLSTNSSVDEIVEIAKRYNPEYFKNLGKKDMIKFKEGLNGYGAFYGDEIHKEKNLDFETMGDYADFQIRFFTNTLTYLTTEDSSVTFDDLPQSALKGRLGDIMIMSIVLSTYFPDFYIPNFFVMQFIYLKKLVDKYEIDDFPDEIPNRSAYRDRCLYYLEICLALLNFRLDNDFETPAEFYAFLFDYEMKNLKEEMEINFNKPMPSIPEQAWILVGNYSEGEKEMKHGFWQANELTCKGDIMLFYEKSPVKKLNSVWIALEDGVKDPFVHYYSHTYIGNKIEIPADKAITFEEFKNSEYFKTRNKEGNFVSKNFQDVSGWAVTSADYSEIKKMLEAKGFDTSVLPSLYEPKVMAGIEIIHEDDVSWKLLVPRLEEMGWKYKEDFFDEVEFPAGRGTTGHEMDKRPDFCLHLSGGDRDKEAQVVIEVKLDMKNNQEIKANYDQGVSYAKWGNARVLVICDKNQIRVYERNNKNQFVPFDTPTARFRWENMQELEKFNELKRLLSKK